MKTYYKFTIRSVFLCLAFVLSGFLLSFLFSSKVQAITIIGDTQVEVGGTLLLEIVASPSNTSFDTAQISLQFSPGVTISEYVPPLVEGWYPEIGLCEGNQLFTSNLVCIDLTRETGTIAPDDSLGLLILNGVSQGTVTVTGFADNGYINDSEFEQHDGVLMTINVGSSNLPPTGGTPPGSLPTASIFTEDNRITLAMFFFGCAGFVIFNNKVKLAWHFRKFTLYCEKKIDSFGELLEKWKEEEVKYKRESERERYASKVEDELT